MINELNILLNAVQKAGKAILDIQKNELRISKKANNDFVTVADLLANDILKSDLLTAFPADGWLSEESIDDAARLECKRVWIIDPIDGTKEYVAGLPEFAVSAALAINGEPMVAAVYNPATAEFYHAIRGGGAWRGSTRLRCYSDYKGLTLLASRSEYRRGDWSNFDKTTLQIRQIGSIAYKLALVASGAAHATFSLSPKNEWDIAAGMLLVSEAGGYVSDKNKKNIILNQKNTKVDGIVASGIQYSNIIFSVINSQ